MIFNCQNKSYVASWFMEGFWCYHGHGAQRLHNHFKLCYIYWHNLKSSLPYHLASKCPSHDFRMTNAHRKNDMRFTTSQCAQQQLAQ